MPRKKKIVPHWDVLRVYGIWEFETSKLVFISLTMDAAELAFDIEDYDPDDYGIVHFDVAVDVNSLER